MGTHKNQFKEVASIKISAYFDVFNNIITQFQVFDKRKADLLCCLDKQVQNVPKDVIAIYDRAYGSQTLPFFHHLHGSKYVIRLKTSFSNTVKKFIQSPDNELIITENLNEKTYKRLEEFGIRQSASDSISYRLVKVVLSTGEIEVLMTNLDNTFTIKDLDTLYGLRWRIETCFFCLKNFQMLGTFSGYSDLAVGQDIYVNLLFYNLQTIAQIESQKEVEKLSISRKNKQNKNRKAANAGYQVNRNVGAGVFRAYLASIFTCLDKDLKGILEEMGIYLGQSIEKIKPNDKERKRKKHHQNDRHHTGMNYKRGF